LLRKDKFVFVIFRFILQSKSFKKTMERDDDDDIPTPSTSRSNSINEDEERPSSPPVEETAQSDASPPS
jgi:hypothetical protein